MTATSQAVGLDEDRWCYRMKDLCEATGLPRQAIHKWRAPKKWIY